MSPHSVSCKEQQFLCLSLLTSRKWDTFASFFGYVLHTEESSVTSQHFERKEIFFIISIFADIFCFSSFLCLQTPPLTLAQGISATVSLSPSVSLFCCSASSPVAVVFLKLWIWVSEPRACYQWHHLQSTMEDFFFLCLFCRQVSHSSGWPWAHFIAKDNLKLLILLPLPHLSDGFISDSSELHKDFPGDFALFLGCLSISQSRVLPLYFFFQLKYKSYFINAMFSFFWIISLGEVPRSRISGSKGMDVFVHLSHHHLLSLWAGPTSPCFNPVRDDWLPQLFPWPWWPSNLNDCLLTPAACKCGKEASRDELSYCPRASPRLRLPLVPWCTLTGNSCTSPQSSRLREFLCSLSPTWSWDPSDSRPSPPKPGSPNTEYG